jgi:iron(III) transport system ATP-binding protein
MSVKVERLSKSFGALNVIPDLSLTFRENSISVLLGPSGCGKTTTLRCIAGLEDPTGGIIRIGDDIVFSREDRINIPPERRGLGMVFQSYAIWPHLTVFENVAVPLRARKADKATIRAQVEETLGLVGLAGFGDRPATKLSGGQQQRVAIARCIVHQPRLIVLDEPLSNLDAKLRIEMRAELRQLQRRVNATMLFVTHDQEEAMSLADEVFLFNRGRIEQHGSPRELYGHPSSRYVAEFLGKANLFSAMVTPTASGSVVSSPDGVYALATTTLPPAEPFVCMVRPEAWQVSTNGGEGIPGSVADAVFLGDRQDLKVTTPFGPQYVTAPGHEVFSSGDRIKLTVAPDLIQLVPEKAPTG